MSVALEQDILSQACGSVNASLHHSLKTEESDLVHLQCAKSYHKLACKGAHVYIHGFSLADINALLPLILPLFFKKRHTYGYGSKKKQKKKSTDSSIYSLVKKARKLSWCHERKAKVAQQYLSSLYAISKHATVMDGTAGTMKQCSVFVLEQPIPSQSI